MKNDLHLKLAGSFQLTPARKMKELQLF